MTHIQIFATAIGDMAIAWEGEKLERVYLPEKNRTALVKRIVQHFPQTENSKKTPAWVTDLIRKLQDFAKGKRVDFSRVALNLARAPAFHSKIWQEVQRIPHGKYATYGEVAKRVGSPKAARAVGQAMAKNPFPVIVPCHRVMAANGNLCGFSAYGGKTFKERLLDMEGVALR